MDFGRISRNITNLVTANTADLQEELKNRELNTNVVPLNVFHDDIKPYLNWLTSKQGYDIPSEYVLLTMLTAYSTAIGSAVTVSQNGSSHIYLPIWGCNVGISSSGKSMVQSIVLEPIDQIQTDLDTSWKERTQGLSHEQISRTRLEKLTYRQSHIATFVKTIMPDNPKGVLKVSEELLEWINGMNQLSKKEGTDEQFWLTTWNAARFDNTQSNKQYFILERPFVNVLGGVQPNLLYRFFEKDRDTSGFVFRILFAKPMADRIARPNGDFTMPPEYKNLHRAVIEVIHNTFKKPFEEEWPNLPTPIRCTLSKEAVNLYRTWTDEYISKINAKDDSIDMNIHAGILGKIKEYALRFSAIIKITDLAYEHVRNSSYPTMRTENSYTITTAELSRALKIADFFYKSAADVSELVKEQTYAPAEVMVAAQLFKANKSLAQMAEVLYPKMDKAAAKSKVNRNLKKWLVIYARVFNAKVR